MAVVEITFWFVLNRFMKTSQLVSSHLNQQRWGVLYHKIFTLNLTFCCCSILGSYLLSLGSYTEGESISVKSQPRYQANNSLPISSTKTNDQQWGLMLPCHQRLRFVLRAASWLMEDGTCWNIIHAFVTYG